MSLVAVFDTNVLISASISYGGPPFRCLALAKAGLISSVTCQPILDEFREKLTRKFLLSEATTTRAIEEVRRFSRVVDLPSLLTGVLVDEADHKVLECAVTGTATYIVTGDRRHLLPLRQFQGIAIITPADFLLVASQAN
jgi:putative PIN family toxin of toxin-antitoxin system